MNIPDILHRWNATRYRHFLVSVSLSLSKKVFRQEAEPPRWHTKMTLLVRRKGGIVSSTSGKIQN